LYLRQPVQQSLEVSSTPLSIDDVRSPQSNGMAESFVKTFKRDNVYVHDRPDAQSGLAQLPRWFDDYNDNHPHKALRMKSSREFIRGFHQQAANCPVCWGQLQGWKITGWSC
jgi:transposase InsO family protein